MEGKKSFWTSAPGIMTGLAALVTALVAVATYLGTRDDDSKGPSTTTVVVQQPPASGGPEYPQKTKDAFIDSCAAQGAAPSVCGCALSYLEQTVSLSELEQAEDDLMRWGEISDPTVARHFNNALTSCV